MKKIIFFPKEVNTKCVYKFINVSIRVYHQFGLFSIILVLLLHISQEVHEKGLTEHFFAQSYDPFRDLFVSVKYMWKTFLLHLKYAGLKLKLSNNR